MERVHMGFHLYEIPENIKVMCSDQIKLMDV